MPLAAGQTLTHYELLGPLGAGGMGEVWRARDTRLEREVAIKVLPEHFADDEERLRRFEREAKTLASLNHPNVAGIHGIDQVGDTCFLAMELVPGVDLAERLARGPLPVDDAVDVCRQIAEGLEAAHEVGVVHRDLKPANVRVTPDGIVKILDFGLAKPLRPKSSKEGTTTAESDSFLVTEEGLVLGTPTYMSPEQARGKPVDRRTDIWAFGCVLYECLTGKRAFGGESLTDILAAIVEREPDWSALPAATPQSVRQVLSRALAKDPRVRLRDVGEARVVLQEGELAPAGLAPARPRHPAILVVGGVALGAVLGALASPALRGDHGDAVEGAPVEKAMPRVRSFSEPCEIDDEGERAPWISTSLSPDGAHLAAWTRDVLVLRSLDSLEVVRIPANIRFNGAMSPVAWSPDSRSIAYIDGNAILRMTERGENKVELHSEDERAFLSDLAWLDDGRIVFTAAGVVSSTLRAIPASGGSVIDLAVVEGKTTGGWTTGITALPGGRFVASLVRADGAFSVVTAGEGEVRTVFVPPWNELLSCRGWLPGGLLLFERPERAEVWAVPLSLDPLAAAGEPFFVREGTTGASVASDGTLAYVETVGEETFQLAWWSPGAETEPIGRAHTGTIDVSQLSRKHGAIFYRTMDLPKTGLWKYDVRRALATEIPIGDQDAGSPLALADGRIVYTRLEMGADGIGYQSYLLPPSGRGEPEEWVRGAYVMDVDADMRHAFAAHVDLEGRGLCVVDFESLERRTLREDLDGVRGGSLSADGDWALFLAGSQTRSEAYLMRFPSGDGEWQVSTDGATAAAFAPDDSAIYYVDRQRRFYRVDLETEPDVVLGSPELVGQADVGTRPTAFREAQDSDRFLVVQASGSQERRLVVVLDWGAELAGR